MNTKNLVDGLRPIVGGSPKILILGTMPGGASLKHKKYYAHSKNLFWTIISEYLCIHEPCYEARIQALIKAGVAVWDVLKSCEREGSSDNSIKNDVPNELVTFLDQYKTIERIGFNGSKAEKKFIIHIKQKLTNKKCFQYVSLPSTSSRNFNTEKEKQDVIKQWAILFNKIESDS